MVINLNNVIAIDTDYIGIEYTNITASTKHGVILYFAVPSVTVNNPVAKSQLLEGQHEPSKFSNEGLSDVNKPYIPDCPKILIFLIKRQRQFAPGWQNGYRML